MIKATNKSFAITKLILYHGSELIKGFSTMLAFGQRDKINHLREETHHNVCIVPLTLSVVDFFLV